MCVVTIAPDLFQTSPSASFSPRPCHHPTPPHPPLTCFLQKSPSAVIDTAPMCLSRVRFLFSQITWNVSFSHTFAFYCILCDSINKERYSLGKTEPVFLRSIPYLLINVVLKKDFVLRFCCPFYSVLFYNNIVSHSFHSLQVLRISATSRVKDLLPFPI